MLFRTLIKASLATVFAAPIIGLVWNIGFGVYDGSLAHTESVTASLAIGLMLGTATLLYVMPAIFLLGIPAFLVLRRFDLANLATCLSVTLIPGVVMAALTGEYRAGLLTIPFAIASGLVFWSFARKVAHRNSSGLGSGLKY
jgi:hypothetical protein